MTALSDSKLNCVSTLLQVEDEPEEEEDVAADNTNDAAEDEAEEVTDEDKVSGHSRFMSDVRL